MAEQIAQDNLSLAGRGLRAVLRLQPDPWSVGAVLIAALVLMPILSVM
ncbi:hypothetical protein [Rhodovulum sp.]|nr:hypothetical protein [Rhodovulum sp.]